VVTSTHTEAGLNDPVYESSIAAASLLSTAADPNRMAILMLLVHGRVSARTLKANVPIAPSLMSYHLKVLRDAGLIVSGRRGRWMDYELVDGAFDRLRRAIPTPDGNSDGSRDRAASVKRCAKAHPGARTRPTRVNGRRHGGATPNRPRTSEDTI
jgi:ArsR family transcriptional regulator